MKKYFAIVLVLALLSVAAIAVSANGISPACPNGGGWTRVNNGHWTEVAGATNYCLKFGIPSQNGAAPGDCVPEDPIYGINGPGSIPGPASRCPLHHWSYFVPPAPQCGPDEWTTDEGCIPKTYLCHATGSGTNPFNMITPVHIGVLMGHVGPGHQGGEDIIPPIPFYLPSGQNWDTVGQAIWENECEIPEPPHDYELVFDFRNECEGNNYYRIMLTDFGQYVSTLYHSGFFVWSEPFLLESRTFGPFDLGEHGTFPAVTLDEPEICQAVHELAFVHTEDCVDWLYGYVLDGVETIIASGEWVDQLEQEKIFVSFEVFLPAGEIASRTPIFGPWYLVEPTEDDSGKCYVTCDETVLNRSWTEEILTPEGAVQVTTFFEYVDSLDLEVVCRVTKEVEIVYESCLNAESTYEVPGEWTEWFTVNGPNKERSRTVEVFDGETDFKCGEYTEYDQECFADDFIWVWQGCGCSIRDRTYELYQFGSPPLVAQRAYCGCDFSCMDEGAWNDSGYVNNCQGEDYTFWDELPKWCGFTSCE